MLDCLLVKMNCTGNLLEFCDQLEKILPLSTDEGLLTSIIAEFRRGMLKLYYDVLVTINIITSVIYNYREDINVYM